MTDMRFTGVKPLLSADMDENHVLLRKEVLKLIVNLSSSIGTKGTEKGLLM